MKLPLKAIIKCKFNQIYTSRNECDIGMFREKSFLKKVIGFSIPTWVGFAISFISTPIVTRIFVPSEIGRINLFSTILNLLMLVAYLGFDQAFVRFYKELPGKYNKNEIFTFALSGSLLFGIVISTAILIFNRFVSLQITGTENFLISGFLSASLIANIFLKFLNLYSRMEQKIVIYAVQAITIVIVNKVFFVVVALWNPNHQNAIGMMTLGYLITSITFLFIKRDSLAKITFFDKASAVAMLKFGLPLIPVTALSWLNNSLPQFMLKAFVDFASIGIYTNAVAIATTMNLIQTGFNIYWIPYVYANYSEGKKTIQKTHTYITFSMCLLGILIILSQDIIYLLLGSAYRSSKIFFPFLILSPIAFTIAETTGIGIGISKKSYLNIISFLGCTSTNIVLSLLLIPRIGIEGAAISSGLSAIVLFTLKTILGEKYYRSITSYFQTIFSILVIILVAFVNYYFYDNTFLKYLLFIVLLVLLLIFNRNVVSDLKNTLKVKVFRFFKRK
jgi:O-antigen/teichoic acid export membrane protein